MGLMHFRAEMPPPWGMDKPLPRSSSDVALKDDDLRQAVDARLMASADARAIESKRRQFSQRYHDKMERIAQLQPLVPPTAGPRVPLSPDAVKRRVPLQRAASFAERDRKNAGSQIMLAKYTTQYKRRMIEEMRQSLSTTRGLSASRMPIRAGAAAWGPAQRIELRVGVID